MSRRWIKTNGLKCDQKKIPEIVTFKCDSRSFEIPLFILKCYAYIFVVDRMTFLRAALTSQDWL